MKELGNNISIDSLGFIGIILEKIVDFGWKIFLGFL